MQAFGAPPGRVDPDDDVAGDRGRAEPERELGHVVEEHAGVARPVGVEGGVEVGGPRRAAARVLGPRPGVVLEAQGDPVAVSRPSVDELGDRRHE